MPYQDVWRDGQLVTKGRRECAGRFDAIAAEVGPISDLLDVGGWDGYFSRRFAEAGVDCTLIEPRAVPDLPDGVTHRREAVTADTVLPAVDVALALAVFHHMPDWEQVYRNLRCCSDVLVVEIPHPDEAASDLAAVLPDAVTRIAPIYDRLTDEGRVFADTRGPNKVRRPLVAVRNTWDGTVDDGSGAATGLMEARPDDFWQPLGYVPVPGTLNVKVGRKGKSWVRRLPAPVTLAGGGEKGTPGPYWPVLVDGIPAHVRLSKAQTVVEVVADVHLRSLLCLATGDQLTIRPRG